MKKLNLSVITLSVLLASSIGYAAGNRAVQIDINGIGPAVDAAAMETVRQVVGHAVAAGVIDKFEIRGVGIEGGFSACAQASPFTKSFRNFVSQLRTIRPNPNTTAYSTTLLPSCGDEPVFCTQEVKLCPDGSYVGRTGPNCAFAPCPTPVVK